jgi:hypothetical protein
MFDNEFNDDESREKQLRRWIHFDTLVPQCKQEYLKIPLDLPWKEMANDVPLAFEKYGWYGMVHRRHTDWIRSPVYGGLGLTYNPSYKFDIPKHAHGLGQPRTDVSIRGKDTYDDCLGLRTPTDVTTFRSFKTFFDKLKLQYFQGRFAEVKASEHGAGITEENKEFIWHTDEPNEVISRLLIPLIYDEDYWIELESGTKIYFEPGYAYHWDTFKPHRWNFKYHSNIKNRTCIVLGWAPWLKYQNDQWSKTEYFNKKHPMDIVNEGLLIEN